VSLLLIMVIYGKKPSKTWLQQNLQISTNHKYRMYNRTF
jgi:hypothetical protein